MRMYLSSYRCGNEPGELLRLLGEGRRTAFMCNAMDAVEQGRRTTAVAEEIARLKDIGLEPVEIDLRDYFGKPEELRTALKDFDLIWVRGGNVFNLRKAYKQSGFDAILTDFLAGDAVVYGGYSAGACVLSPSLRGYELVDSLDMLPAGYEEGIILTGLGLIPYSFAPHYRSDHAESADVEKMVEYFKANGVPFKALHDGQAIVVDGDSEKIVG